MNLKTLIFADKTSLTQGEWKSGTIQRKLWPSKRAKSRAYKFGPSYKWRIITFVASGYNCRLRILLNIKKQIFRATLGVTTEDDTVTLCDYEFHATEPGWHCHARCDDISTLDSAVNRIGSRRMPNADRFHRRADFTFGNTEITEVTAFNCAINFFKIDKRAGGIL